MHMADALLSPAVGATMWAGSAAAIGYSSKKLKENLDNKTIPLMGIMGAFIFAAQMINFTIPGTGSSGHIGGGMILTVLLGPYAAFLAIASVLVVQALFFADGGLLALGCNIWNLGIYPCFIAYPLIYKPIAGDSTNTRRIFIAAIVSVIIALQLGAFSVVLETLLSGKSELPFETFVLLMQPIHLAIGLIEGMITAGIILYVKQARPEILEASIAARPLDAGLSIKNVLVGFVILAVMTGGALSWFASTHPDGLEWSIEKVTGKGELEEQTSGIVPVLKDIQEKTAFLPDYGFKPAAVEQETEEAPPAWPGIEPGTSVAGIVGAAIVLMFIVFIGFGIRIFKKQ
ncbi:MAG: energy-coupling factor ABC transporter permease [Smithella sp.]|nr:energy-coupling factor ABC transporter permease [Smithella sp.]MDM7986911.1 energy-coupling factor ABC transporter permease [Smithella sp.]HQG65398.1 energy-coupling factor ABC transporter permease [Smithella sp.]